MCTNKKQKKNNLYTLNSYNEIMQHVKSVLILSWFVLIHIPMWKINSMNEINYLSNIYNW